MNLTDYVGLIGGVIGGVYALVQLFGGFVDRIRKRGRIELASYRVQYYIHRYTDDEIDNAVVRASTPIMGAPLSKKDKDALRNKLGRAFTVIEFELQNKYPLPISIGRIMLDDWIFADHWIKPMYGEERDYRAYDLYTRQRVDLSTSAKLGPGELLGRRVEIHENSYGPD